MDANGENNAWLELCRRAVAAQREIFADVSGIEERTEYDGVGEGGDHSLVIDRAAEDAIFELLGAHHESSGEAFTAISEERGEISFGEGATRVVIDPIDGSLNARRTIPSHCLSVGVASGETMADVDFAYIYVFGAGDKRLSHEIHGRVIEDPHALILIWRNYSNGIHGAYVFDAAQRLRRVVGQL